MAAPLDLEQRIGAGRLRVVESTRALVETVAGVGPDVDDDALARAAAAVEAATAALVDAGAAPTAGRPRTAHYGDFLPHSLLVGQAHPLSPAATYTVTDGVLEVRVRFGAVYEGPPGCVHGGIVALAFDELFGMCNVVNGRGGLTGRLSVRYRTPTPLHRELRMTAWPVHREGRRMRLHGTVHADDVLTADAEGLFVVPRVPLRDGPGRDA
ncbi:MAG: PaaI family thioesterase [Actinomycetota bacterium]